MASGTCVGVAGLLYDCHKHIYFGRWTGKMESEKGRQGNGMQGVAWGRQKAFPFLSLPFPPLSKWSLHNIFNALTSHTDARITALLKREFSSAS